jgi:hypothetical protein
MRRLITPGLFAVICVLFSAMWISLMLVPPQARGDGTSVNASYVGIGSWHPRRGVCSVTSTHPYDVNVSIHAVNVSMDYYHRSDYLWVGDTKWWENRWSISGTLTLTGDHEIPPGGNHTIFAYSSLSADGLTATDSETRDCQ